MKEKKDPAILEAFLSLVLLIFLRYNPRKSMTRMHSQAAIELSASTHSFHQRLGILSLSRSFVTPTTNF